MADFVSDFKASVGDKVLPNGDALKRKIDSKRETWLKGISSTKYGKKEDPTYLHFRFIFDFAESSEMDPETFLAPSPLFKSASAEGVGAATSAATSNSQGGAAGQSSGDKAKQDQEAIKNAGVDASNFNFSTTTDFFYGSKFRINSRAQQGFFNINGGGVGYMGAQNFLAQRSTKRKEMLEAFKKGLRFVNEKCPYYFQSISGLDQLLKVDIKNLHKPGGKAQRTGTLNIECLESIDMRIFALAELYRKAIYDYTYHRVMLPENLRKFRMWLVVSEIRNIQLSYGINDVLNPFSIPSVAQGANFLDSFNTQTGLLDNAAGLLQKSTNQDEDQYGSYELGPYAFIYQFDQCEFDFDESYPSFATIDNKGGSAVTNKFKIHVGRVKDYKIQFNSLADIMQKDDNIKKMVLADVWGSLAGGTGGNYVNYDYDKSSGIASVDFSSEPNPAEAFAQMASNFITNSVADLKDQGVQLLQGALLGNIYGLGGFDPASQLRSYSNFDDINAKGLQLKIPNPFKDNTPQASGLGGPPRKDSNDVGRIYPDINEDAYTGLSSSNQQNLGTAYSGNPGNPGTASGDVYANNPGSDLGLPDRQYPKPGGDEYKNVPGSDSGVPGRVYPLVKGDVYLTNPGPDSGLPNRQYPVASGDEYNDVPGSSLGVPTRLYPEPNDDAYPTNPGADLGLPNRQYPPVNEDVYPDSQSIETNDIGKVYPDPSNNYGNISEKEYDDTQDSALNENIGDVYPDTINKYPEINEKVYKENIELQDESLGEVYKESKNVYPSVNDTAYEDSIRMNSSLNEDVYRNVPGRDLGTPGRNYESINDDQYNISNRPINVTNIGRVYPGSKNENN